MTSYKHNVNLSIASIHHFVRLKNSSIITNSESAIKDCHYFPLSVFNPIMSLSLLSETTRFKFLPQPLH